jgi:hypothetical protein
VNDASGHSAIKVGCTVRIGVGDAKPADALAVVTPVEAVSIEK